MPLSRRYTPEKDPEEIASFGMDFSFVIPPGIGLTSGELHIWSNSVEPEIADAEWTVYGPVEVRGRAVYALLGGGLDGKDYQLRWTATDTAGNTHRRTAMVLCALTS